jgi:hypothetical protein
VPAQVERVTPADPDSPASIEARAHIAIDPLVVAGGSPLEPGVWVVAVRVRGCGVVRRTGLVPVDVTAARLAAQPGLLGHPAITVAPRFRDTSPHTALDVGENLVSFGVNMRDRLREGPTVDRKRVLTAVLPAVTRPDTSALPIVVELRADRDSPTLASVEGELLARGTDVVLRAQLPRLSSVTLPPGRTRLLVLWRLTSSERSAARLGSVGWSRRRFTTWPKKSGG